ncbi:hypothetical protein OYC64_004653 [Pagothenia borchgrevinki]|uniref:Reverse transcriptase domain-containing protein n=1 Tax=Pagothenia borchgrevinki TaxID=8213 RepID=A0ABD2FYY6_PAGBO
MLFIDYSSAFITIVPSKLAIKLRELGLNSALSDWILNFLTGRPQAVRVGNITSSTLILNTGAPQGCVLSPLLYSLFTHDCVATHSSNTIVKFADDTTVIDQITDDDETAYREEVENLTSWCQDNNLHLNISKTKELIVDYRKQQGEGQVKTAQHITRTELPSMEDLYSQRLRKKSLRIIKDPHHPSHKLFFLLPSGRRYRSILAKTRRFGDSCFPRAVRLLNN